MKLSHINASSHEVEEAKAAGYFEDISISQICEKYCITEEEFEAFGLSPEEFLGYVNFTLPELQALCN